MPGTYLQSWATNSFCNILLLCFIAAILMGSGLAYACHSWAQTRDCTPLPGGDVTVPDTGSAISTRDVAVAEAARVEERITLGLDCPKIRAKAERVNKKQFRNSAIGSNSSLVFFL